MYPLAWPGGLKQMTKHLDRVARLECVDYVWLAPVYPSPRYDHGYDVDNYYGVDGRLGGIDDLDKFIGRAHELGLKVLMDLVLNHTSTSCPWFFTHPNWYCLEEDAATKYPGWHNLFDNGEAWAWDETSNTYYCHLFHEKQADLNWFPDGKLNTGLVAKFRNVVNFWLKEHGVDGFRLDAVQAINKDFTRETLEAKDLLCGIKSCEVINAIFTGDGASVTQSGEKPFLMVELVDPSFGKIVDFYAENAPVVDFCLNILVKDLADKSSEEFYRGLRESCKRPNYMLDLESHDSPRFASRWIQWGKITSLSALVGDDPQAICLYQGQELGLKNPNKKALPDQMLLELDAQTAMRFERGESLNKLRHGSRANTRVPIPLERYESKHSITWLSRLVRVLKAWKQNP